jgi:hypothetical protein
MLRESRGIDSVILLGSNTPKNFNASASAAASGWNQMHPAFCDSLSSIVLRHVPGPVPGRAKKQTTR